MTQTQIKVIDGRHWVFRTETGIDQRVVGVGFARPRDAIAYSDQLTAAGSTPRPTAADLAESGDSTSRDARLSAGGSTTASATDPAPAYPPAGAGVRAPLPSPAPG